MQSPSLSSKRLNTVHGILLLNKPKRLTSQQAVSQVKRLFNSNKAGHTGSLDPIATGLLPVCLGEATKFSQFLLAADKHYRVEAVLGQRTDTGDAEGTVINQQPVPALSHHDIETILSEFLGSILQIPPIFSALKHNGKPLYHWARKGTPIQKNARPISIDELSLVQHSVDRLVLEVRCSKGTYIRTLIDDIGNKLGCGAHVTSLYRLSVGSHVIENSIDLQTLDSLETIERRMEHVLPLETMLPEKWPTVQISEPAAFYLKRGQPLNLPNTPQSEWLKLVLKTDHQLLGIGRVLTDGRIAPHRLLETT